MAKPRWLSADEVRSWTNIVLMSLLLPSYLDRRLRADSDLTFFEYHVLAMLSESKTRSQRMSDLARLTGGSPSRLSHVVAKMERHNLLRRTSSPTDGRVVVATLTDTGYDRLVAAAPAHAEFVHTHLVDTLTAQEFATLGKLAAKMSAAIEQADS